MNAATTVATEILTRVRDEVTPYSDYYLAYVTACPSLCGALSGLSTWHRCRISSMRTWAHERQELNLYSPIARSMTLYLYRVILRTMCLLTRSSRRARKYNAIGETKVNAVLDDNRFRGKECEELIICITQVNDSAVSSVRCP